MQALALEIAAVLGIDQNLPEGWSRVKCEYAGYVTRHKWIDLTGGGPREVDFELVLE